MKGMDAVNPPTYHYNQQMPPMRPQKKRRKLRWFLLFLVILVALGFASTKLLSQTNKIFTGKENIFVRVGKLIISEDKPLKGEEQGQVNILLLGMGGPGHEGPLLTDTMIVASIDPVTSEVVLISIPRDFLVQLPKRGFNKVNAAYAYAELDEEGSGGEAAIAMAEKITGLTIPYYASIDFKGFTKAVDHVGGVDINIDRTFTDSSYPDYNNGYLPPVTFTKGPEHMNGERALIFARSRKGNNNEGSDFARSERQKKVMVAMKDKVSEINFTDLGTINNLLSDFTENFRTNMEPFELKRLADLGKKIEDDNFFTLSVEPQGDLICGGLIDIATGRRPLPPPPPPASTTPESEGETETTETPKVNAPVALYVVQPCEGKTLQDIHAYLEVAINIANLQKEKAVIEVQNSTGKPYALDRWRNLASEGLEIKITTFRGKTPYERTIFYDNSKGSKPKTLQYLKDNFTFDVSDVQNFDTQQTSDFVIILGKDAL